MAATSHLVAHATLFLSLVFHMHLLVSGSTSQDMEALLAFKAGSDASEKLTSWNNSTNLCSWDGVSCINNRVTRLVLENLDLQGSIQPLTSLTQLRVLSLKRNRFSGTLPSLSNFTALKLLFLSYNHFSGDFPATVTSLFRLYRLDLSHNNLSGEIPATVNHLAHLLTLRLEENRFSGYIPGVNLPNLQDFNVSGNLLSGEIPKSLSAFPVSSFGQNPSLCGAPIQNCTGVVPDPTKPGSEGAIASPVVPRGGATTTVSSSPSSMPANDGGAAPKTTKTHRNGGSKISPVALIAIIVGDVLVLGIVSLLLYCYFWRNYSAKLKEGKGSKLFESEKIVYSSSPYPAQGGGGGFERGKMVFFEGEKRFELEDLLRASAEMLGKGGFGTAYKAVLDDGNVVAVKRLKDAQIGGKREFEQHMELLGRLRHQNIVSLRAYYFARDEKLLVYDYMPNGSLFWLLHGNRGPGRTPLDWTTRLKIAAGAARGVAFIHNSCKSLRLNHGNIKSTNILLDKQGNARVSDFGLSVFAGPGPSTSGVRSNGYRAPEVSSDGRKQSQKSDVYSFGVFLLELLTGKCPSAVEGGGAPAVDLPRWVQSVVREEWTAEVFDLELMRYKDIEEEMVGLLQVAMACTAPAPDQRPSMSHVVKMIEELRGVQVSPCHDTLDSVSESPSVSEDACGASQ
ncbi:probable leucine-rich repeat receptor-like protein kinase At1g68400 [Arachis duranensis]|uniref:Probable leucine-rich repeat receptor-like protein kinase At1g68400 n=1 Tax=Arachis duranensis TaxID=130453 RepID=A0A6P4BGQ0_ARADU|nr:probable leucine-rich repeat receptor-like protein kinase At1g68400 [Arachis duranensis]